VFTRTRLDYERSVLKLSTEQVEMVRFIKEKGDYIIKGAAGTGKTLVLLHSFEQELKENINPEKIILLTYTHTLVKYSAFLAYILNKHQKLPLIQTADSFLLHLFNTVFPGFKIDFTLPNRMTQQYNTTSFLSNEELAVEIEEFLWGNLINEEEYIELRIPRIGMRQPLSKSQRQAVWEIQSYMRKYFEASKCVSRNLAIRMLLEQPNLDSWVHAQRQERIFLDEGQDLPLGFLKLVKLLSARGVVLAMDSEQSIYHISNPFLRAELEFPGHVRTLQTNYRNTRQILEFANRFRWGSSRSDSPRVDGERLEQRLLCAREGPEPEIIQGTSTEELLNRLAQHIQLMIERIGYDPENICVLCPTNPWVERIEDLLKAKGVSSVNVRDEQFDFQQTGSIRLCTMHSSKGLEFPVVFLFLPTLPPVDAYDLKHIEELQWNLLYVSMTRAMDYLALFLPTNPENPFLQDLMKLKERI